jgi:hypothetical protein
MNYIFDTLELYAGFVMILVVLLFEGSENFQHLLGAL